MNNRIARYKLLYLFTALSLGFGACSQNPTKINVVTGIPGRQTVQPDLQVTEVSSTQAALDFPTSSPSPTLSLPTIEPEVSPTYVPTTTPAATPAPTASPLDLLTPTLTSDQIPQAILALIRGSPDCQFPCLWNITPGKTSSQDVIQQLSLLRFQELVANQINPLIVGRWFMSKAIPSFDTSSVNIRVREKSTQVVAIEFAWGVAKGPRFQEVWAPYELDDVLVRYGQPTRIVIDPFATPDEMDYTIYVEYADRGVLFIYPGRTKWRIDADTKQLVFRVCPLYVDKQVDGGLIRVKRPDDPTPWSEYFFYNPDAPEVRPLGEVTSLSMDQFIDLFTHKRQPACLDVKSP